MKQDRHKPAGPSQRMLRVGELVRHALAQLFARGEIEDDSEITRILAESGIWLRGLMRERPDLERVFLSLTDGSGDAS